MGYQKPLLPSVRSQAERNALVVANLRLVGAALRRRFVRVNGQCGNRVGTNDDLFQIGVLGLMRAADLWDESRGVSFGTFATRHVHGHLQTAVGREGVIRTVGSLHTPKQLEMAAVAYATAYITDDHAAQLPDRQHRDYGDLFAALARLSESDRKLVMRHYLDGTRLSEIAKEAGVKRQAMGMRMAKALKRLRKFMTEGEEDE